jgi:hypothetical protein
MANQFPARQMPPYFEASIFLSKAATVHRLSSVAVTLVFAQEGHSFPEAGAQVFDSPESTGLSRSSSVFTQKVLFINHQERPLPTRSMPDSARRII